MQQSTSNNSCSVFVKRLPILLLISITACCAAVVHHALAVLQPTIANQQQQHCNSSSSSSSSITDCCSDCLGIGDKSYNWMLSCMLWCSLIAVPIGGWLLDKVGNSVCALFSFLLTLGIALLAIASCLRGSVLMLPLLYVGSAVFSLGWLTSIAARERVLGVWFRDCYLTLAFGIGASITRVVALPAFFLLEPLRERVGLQATLFCCAGVCVIGFICAVGVGVLDARYSSKLGLQQQQQQERESLSVLDLRHANGEFWAFGIIWALFTTAYYAYHDNAVEFLHEKFAFSKRSAAQCSSLLHLVGIVASPLAGFIIDKLGHSIAFLTVGLSLMIPASAMLAFTDLPPAIGSAMIGMSISLVNPSALASMTENVSKKILGMAMSVPLMLLPLFSAILHFVIGVILGNDSKIIISEKILRWQKALILIISVDVLAVLIAVCLIVIAVWRASISFTTNGSSRDQKPSSPLDYDVISEDVGDKQLPMAGNSDSSKTDEQRQLID